MSECLLFMCGKTMNVCVCVCLCIRGKCICVSECFVVHVWEDYECVCVCVCVCVHGKCICVRRTGFLTAAGGR